MLEIAKEKVKNPIYLPWLEIFSTLFMKIKISINLLKQKLANNNIWCGWNSKADEPVLGRKTIAKWSWANIYFNKCSLMQWIKSFLQLNFCFIFLVIHDVKDYDCSRFTKSKFIQTMLHLMQADCTMHTLLNVRQVLFCYKHILCFFIHLYKNAFIILSQRQNFNFFLCSFACYCHTALHCTALLRFFVCVTVNK